MDRGAHFFRTDLQVHSPRDLQWSGPVPTKDNERAAYADSLIRACREKKLDAIAITDHHDLCFVKYVREAAKREQNAAGKPVPPGQQIVVFPGIELTLNVPCQALLIFDAEFPDDLFSLVLNALAIVPSKCPDPKTAGIKRLDTITTLETLREELDKHQFLRNRYIILPNLSDSGQHTLLRKGNALKYASMPCVGGYVDGAVHKLGDGNKNIIAGKANEYGNKRVAVFQTSDSRSSNHTELGKHSTWIKWAMPTAEALRQACLAQESRISQSEPEVPSVAITFLSVSNSAFLGPINLDFNRQYNALIGGRGTGKSTILEYIRWGLCDQTPNIVDDDAPNYQLRRANLIAQTLRPLNATIDVGFTVNGIPHVVRRYSATEKLMLKVGDAEFEECAEADIRSILPIQAYSQKQLSNVSVRLDELTRFLEAPVRQDLNEIGRRFERNEAETRQVYATLLRERALKAQLAKDELQLQSLIEQAEAIRKSLTGLSKDDQATLGAKERYDEAQGAFETLHADVERAAEILAQASDAFSELPTELDAKISNLPDAKTLGDIKKEVAKVIADAKKALGHATSYTSAVLTSNGNAKGTLAALEKQWAASYSKFHEAYESAKKRATAHEAKLRALALLEERIKQLRSTIAATKKDLSSLGSPEKRFKELRQAWIGLHESRSGFLEKECAALTKLSNGEIRATIKLGTGTNAVAERLRAAVSGSGIRKEKVVAIAEHIAQSDEPFSVWLNVLDELETLAAHDPEEPSSKTLPTCPVLGSCGLASQDLTRFANSLSQEDWLSLALTHLEDQPVFEYRARASEYIPFQNASAGQQATSLLKALLNQPGPPLLIDQPEEDLDNPVILEVVAQVWKAKTIRQLIFSSHNANLVVNGDAELVVSCDYRAAGDQSRGEISGQGAIDVSAMRESIKRIMEGGEAAFKLRKEKYGF